jgi:hypothetical protein
MVGMCSVRGGGVVASSISDGRRIKSNSNI